MGRQIKLIWDFYGEDAEQTSIHHATHLKEYAQKHQVEFLKIDHEPLEDEHFIAFFACYEKDMIKLRDELRPKRAQLYQE